ncbi:MAG: DUF488 domain-containing protein [Planctomycetota bacterium]|nr:DUF488 domain-containing protein [Planctomycetota bacterium]
MLNRQKALLQLVRLAGGEIDRLVLTKWAFIIRQETASRGGESFYDFVPYQYGPFSFALYQEAEKLVAIGYLKERGNSRWALGDLAAPPVDEKLRQDLSRVSTRFQKASTDELLDYVYHNYPYFTIHSKRKRLAKRAVASLAVYTAGYEAKSVDAFLNGLTENGIDHLIDVRMNPIARRYGFHRSTLSRLSNLLGIKYNHVPQLGIASELRQELNSEEDYHALFRRYESTTLKQESAAIQSVADWIQQSPSVLVCMEAEPTCCHRLHLAKSVSQLTGLPIVHLE